MTADLGGRRQELSVRLGLPEGALGGSRPPSVPDHQPIPFLLQIPSHATEFSDRLFPQVGLGFGIKDLSCDVVRRGIAQIQHHARHILRGDFDQPLVGGREGSRREKEKQPMHRMKIHDSPPMTMVGRVLRTRLIRSLTTQASARRVRRTRPTKAFCFPPQIRKLYPNPCINSSL